MRLGLLLGIGSMLAACGAPDRQARPSSAEAYSIATPVAPEPPSAPPPNRCAARMNRYGFPPGEHAHALQNDLTKFASDVQFVAMETTSEDGPTKRSISLDPNNNDNYSDHFVLLCDDGDAHILEPEPKRTNPEWLSEIQKTYPSCKIAAAFGPTVKEVRYTQTCGKAIHLRRPIPALVAIEEKKAQAIVANAQQEQERERRSALVAQCGADHVTSCEKKKCVAFPPPAEEYCPGGNRLSEQQLEQERLRKRAPTIQKCSCACGTIVAVPEARRCIPRP